MSFRPFSKRRRRDPAADGAPAGAAALEAHADTSAGRERLASMWSDALGRAGTRATQLLVVIVLTGAAVYALLQLSLAVLPLLIALILASALWPLVRLMRRFMSPLLAAWTVFLGSLVVLGGIGTGIVFAVRAEWPTLVEQGVEGFNEAQGMIRNLPVTITQEQIDSAIQTATDFLASSQFGAGALSGLSAAGSFLTGLVLLLVILFFFLKDGDRIWGFFLTPLSGTRRQRGRRIGQTAPRVLGGYVRGTAIVALVDASAIGIGLAILQVPLALPLAVIVFLGAFIPLIGATLAGVLAALVALVANGPLIALIVIIIVIAVNQLEGNLLQPVVMAQSLKLHPLVILFALTAGTIVAGIVGAILAVPIAAVAWSIAKVWNDPVDARPAPPARPAPAPARRRSRKR